MSLAIENVSVSYGTVRALDGRLPGRVLANETLGELSGNDFVQYGEWKYHVTVMGEPSATEPWGWQIDGHHLIVNYFVLGDQVVMTPSFFVMTFGMMRIGLLGMRRRIADYPGLEFLQTPNLLITLAGFAIGLSVLVFVFNLAQVALVIYVADIEEHILAVGIFGNPEHRVGRLPLVVPLEPATDGHRP